MRVRVEIQGLKAKKLTLIEKFTGGKRTEAKNGTVLCHFQDRSVLLYFKFWIGLNLISLTEFKIIRSDIRFEIIYYSNQTLS